jgi:hypothetical protein
MMFLEKKSNMDTFYNGIFTLAFGGGTTVAVCFVYWKCMRTVVSSHEKQMNQLIEAHRSEMETVCASFREANEQRTQDIQTLLKSLKNES